MHAATAGTVRQPLLALPPQQTTWCLAGSEGGNCRRFGNSIRLSITTSGRRNANCYCQQATLYSTNSNSNNTQLLAMQRSAKSPTPTSASFLERYTNLRWLGAFLLLIACLFCAYKLVRVTSSDEGAKLGYTTKLKLVNVFNRHGDRAPSDKLLRSDEHGGTNSTLFWPNGIANITDEGKFRQFRIGLQLRRRYAKLLNFDAKGVLAFSSPIVRCVESLEHTLRGLFDIDQPVEDGLEFASQVSGCFELEKAEQIGAPSENIKQCIQNNNKVYLPSGSGFPGEWHSVHIDTDSIPVLSYEYLRDCPATLAKKNPVDMDMRNSKAVAKLAGVNKLATLLEQKYDLNFNFTALGWWSSIAAELRLRRSWNTLEHGRHFYTWVGQPAASLRGGNRTATKPQAGSRRQFPTLFDLYEQVAVFGYRDRIAGAANYVQLAPLIGSLVQSQLVSLGKSSQKTGNKLLSDEQFGGKRLIFYSSHDSILQLLLHRLHLIDPNDDEPFERRWTRTRNADEVSQLLAGHKMSKFGLSLAFELWQATRVGAQNDVGETFEYMQLAIYNKEDGKFKPIDYKRVELGAACRRLFARLYPNSGDQLDEMFYDTRFKINKQLSCPFDLFRNVTSEFEFDLDKFNAICEGER